MDGKNAKRSDDITDKMWSEVLEFNRNMVQEYLDNQTDLSIKTKIAYNQDCGYFSTGLSRILIIKVFLI